MIIKKTKYQRVGNDYMKVTPLDDFAASQNFIMHFSGKVFG